ncbi:hypothetical protein N9N28_07140 [Rubripirellula amarantea]|nr:hypothetical protein [Rubripirellula amarantea]MDA8744388.1 hypothetical protein [Rubripirellula amarantea]
MLRLRASVASAVPMLVKRQAQRRQPAIRVTFRKISVIAPIVFATVPSSRTTPIYHRVRLRWLFNG